jgi:hypothetical protein
MTALSTAIAAAAPTAVDAPTELLAEAAADMRRAAEYMGGRSSGWDLLEIAGDLDELLPVVSCELRSRHGQIPMPLRIELSNLARAAVSAREYGSALTSIVPGETPSAGALAMSCDEWRRSAEALLSALKR